MNRSIPTRRPVRRAFLVALALATGLPAAALVSPSRADAQMGPRGGGGEPAALDATRRQYEMVRDYVLQTARGVPDDVIDYRPAEEVRSFGELLGHVANASYSFCSAALGEQSPSTRNLEELTDRAQLASALDDAFAYCDRAHTELTGPRLMEEVNLFGQTGPRIWVLVFNATHTWEHYGNLVTYMRLNGIVPPSSGGMSGG